MTQKLDYSREEAMQILNSQSYTDDEKKKLYEQYMNDLKKNRKNAIVNKLNEYARDIPVITKEIYISKLKEYETDDLSKPFEVIETELSNFEADMKKRYNDYLESQNKVEEPPVDEIPAIVEKPTEEEKFDDTIFSEPISDIDDVKPSLLITDQISVINEEPEIDATPLFENASDDSREFMPDETDEHEKGNASAIIISIIAIIIGILVMYSIIKFN